VVDGTIFQDTPMTLVNKGKISHVPILTGSTTDETFTQSDDMEANMKWWYPAISKKEVAVLNRLYPEADYASRRGAVAAAVGDTLNKCAVCSTSNVPSTRRLVYLPYSSRA